MNQESPYISVVIPAYNEGARIALTLREVSAYLSDSAYSHEIIVVDDGSSDGTPDVVEALIGEIQRLFLIRHPKNLGKGMAVKSGFLAAKGQLVFFSDADLSTPIQEVPKFLSYINEGYHVVIGSRALRESIIVVRQPWYREQMGRVFNMLVRLIVVRGFYDTQCGFKCFQREACKPVFQLQTLSGFCFDVELIYLAKRLGLRIKEVPVTWRNNPETKVGALKDSLRMFRDLWRIRLQSVLGVYRRRVQKILSAQTQQR